MSEQEAGDGDDKRRPAENADNGLYDGETIEVPLWAVDRLVEWAVTSPAVYRDGDAYIVDAVDMLAARRYKVDHLCEFCMLPSGADARLDDGRYVCRTHAIVLRSGQWNGEEQTVQWLDDE